MRKILYLLFLLNISLYGNNVCDIEGVKGFKFGMSQEEAFKNKEVNFTYSSYESMTKEAGMSIEEVKELEKAMGILFLSYFSTSFAGYESEGILKITEKGLSGITNIIKIDTSNKNKYIDAYFEIKNLLNKKYGEPKENEYLEYPYEDDFPRGDFAAQALSLGKGKYSCRFMCNGKDDTKYIDLRLSGDKRELTLALGYWNRLYEESTESKEKKQLDEF